MNAPSLFDHAFYRESYFPNAGIEFDGWAHFCAEGFRQNFKPHPLFDTAFYRERYLPASPEANPLVHYMQHAGEKLDTHPLLDTSYYVDQLDDTQIGQRKENQTWLEYFLDNNLNDLKAASKLFSSARYVEQHPEVRADNLNPLCHFVTFRGDKESTEFRDFMTLPALFDSDYYLNKYDDIAAANMDPWKHFCEHGAKENRNPHPIFDTNFYRQKYLDGNPEINPFIDYLGRSESIVDPHPLFDTSFYLSQLNEKVDPGVTPLEHFMQHNRSNLASPSPLFSTKRYLNRYPDIAKCELNPLYHFLRYGTQDRRRTFFDIENISQLRHASVETIEFARKLNVPHLDFAVGLARMPKRPAVICVSHQGSLTGAPLIILKIAESIRAKYGVEVINVIHHPGEINERFELIGPTMDLKGHHRWNQQDLFDADMELFSTLVEPLNVVGAIVNSAESRHFLPTFDRLGIPSISLVHENARCYVPGDFDEISKLSERVIFPSEYVRKVALETTEFEDQATEVLPQGLLNESLLEMKSNDPMNEIRGQLGIPDDATFVLACGTADGRKGVDLFLSTAIIALSEAERGSIFFAWLGGNGMRDPGSNQDQRYWLDIDLQNANVSQYVKMLGQTTDVAPYLQACDMLYLPSRIDPFPCVVNEAMAIGKPVVLFEDGSGCVSMIGEEGGAVIPYGNVAKAADSILELGKYPALRREMGARNRDYVVRNLCFDRYVDKVFDSLMSAASPADRSAVKCLGSSPESHGARSNGKKVIFTLPAWRISGINTFVENLVRKLCDIGFEASILFTTRDPSRTAQTESLPDVPYRFLTAKPVSVEERQSRLKKYLEQNAPCVFVPNYDYDMSAITPDLPIDVGVLGVLHSDEDEHYLHGYQMGHYWDAIVAVSHTIHNRLIDLNPAFEKRTQTICYGIPVEESLPTKRRADKLRLVYTGRIIQTQKRIFDFITLIEKLESRKLPFEITFIGGGDDEVTFQTCLKPWLEKGIARYLGSCSSDVVTKELQAHDALLLMSEYEGLPLSLLEAMAQGCVPVVTEIPSGISEILIHGENGLLSPLGDIDAMADNLVLLHRDRNLLEKGSLAAFQTLQDHGLTVTHMAQKYESVIDGIFENISSPQSPITIPLKSKFVRDCLKKVA